MQSWMKEIDGARTGAEVVATTRDYVSLWSPSELLEFPEDCRQIRIDSEADIARWHGKLAQSYDRERMPESSARVADLITLVTRADERLGEIRTAG
ncbi:MAG: hypothetical protein ABI669_10365 [Usitatibacter sp.]